MLSHWSRLFICASLLISTIGVSHGSVIYNVNVEYEEGFEFNFTMQFENATGIKTAGDLISPFFNFSQKTLTDDGINWDLSSNQIIVNLTFDPATLSLQFNDNSALVHPSLPIRATDIGHDQLTVFIFEDTVLLVADATGLTISRVANQVPEPATLALLGLGLLGIGFARRRRKE